MEAKVTREGVKALDTLIDLSTPARLWVLREFWSFLEPKEREELSQCLAETLGEGPTPLSLFDRAKNRLLDDAGLTAGEKVLLASLMLRELYEIEEFNSRQITENLRDLANPVNNVTAALNGLIAKGEVEIVDLERAARNAHKRYRLTSVGITSATSLADRREYLAAAK